MSDTSFFNDPYAAPGRGAPGRLTDVSPQGYQIEFDDDGNATAVPPYQQPMGVQQASHFDNLAEHMDDSELNEICTVLLEAIEEDKESRSKRDEQYEEGLNRTGMGSNVVGGANFPGASRAVHPLLLESSLDFAGAMMNEMLPPGGPCKTSIQGDDSEQKDDRAKRVMRWMNYQLTELMPGAYHEFEIGFTQCPLGGAFYTKLYISDDGVTPAVSFIPVDHVYRPYNDGDFYNQPRITHAQAVDRWTFMQNVDSGLWRDVVAYDVKGGNLPEMTSSDEATDRIVGRNQPTRNVDAIREVYECSVLLKLDNVDQRPMPYLCTIDVEARKVLSLYRNWRENDETAQRCVFLIEWPFWPWRGGYPVGLTHMIGTLSGAATGALRALLDAAHLNNSQTGVRLKGGASSGGQNMQPRVTEVTEIQGSLAQDDVRKAYMPFKFNEPSPTLLNLLGFLVDAGRGVVRSTYDDMDKFGSQTPVGTTQMFLEQGLRNLGAVHGRMHRSMRLFLKQLYQINQDTLTPITVVDALGELSVQPQDFQGPMQVIPVSDPRLFSDLQRKALAQTLITRSSDPVAATLYNHRATESYFLRQMGADNPDQFLVPNPQPQRTNAVAENVAASQGQPIQAYPGQDHEAHITVHLAYLKSPFFGSNPSVAVKFIPGMIDHLGQHLALWYSDAMLEAATQALRQQTGNDQITLQSFMGLGTEVGLDRLMAELDDHVLELAQQQLEDIPEAIEEARQLLKALAPPMPMDPSLVAQEDVQRQRDKDKADSKAKIIDLQERRRQAEAKEKQTEIDSSREDVIAHRKLDIEQQSAGLDASQTEAERNAALHVDMVDIAAKQQQSDDKNATTLEVARMKTAADERKAEADRAQADQHAKADRAMQERVAKAGHESSERTAQAKNRSSERTAAAKNESSERVAKTSAQAALKRTASRPTSGRK